MNDAAPAFQAAALQGMCRLADWGLIQAVGDDAARFLHGQLTQDVEHLGPADARLAGYCSAKGRLLATFVAWQRAPGDILLATSADVLPAVLKRLSMFVLRSRCRLSDATGGFLIAGLAGAAATAWLGPAAPSSPWTKTDAGAAQVVRLPDATLDGAAVPRYLWVAPQGTALPELPELSAAAWAWLEVASGVARVVAATSEQFVPQMVNLELVGGVNFQKGCYPGQEVVARSQYRGTLKRRAFRVLSEQTLQPGQELFHSSDPGQPAGLVVLAASLEGRHSALVELKIAAAQGPGTLHAGSAEGPLLQVEALPYALPLEAA
jgi:folate-binding protein YgfZ